MRWAIVDSVVCPVTFQARAARSAHGWHDGLPAASNAEAYGKQASSATPRFCSSVRASDGHQPPQLAPCALQKWRSASDRSIVAPFLILAIDSSDPHEQNDTQEPQLPWSLTAVT